MRDFDELWIWDDPALAGRLAWYRAADDHGHRPGLRFEGVTFEKSLIGLGS